jgi:ATP-dependent protease ClpP protease subunit
VNTPAHRPVRGAHRGDSERDRWFTAAEARDYGLVDDVVNRIGQVASGPPAG